MRYILISLIIAMSAGCDIYTSGHCYYFAADYMDGGEAKHWPNYGEIETAIEHIAPDKPCFYSNEIKTEWVEKWRCVINTGDHFLAIRKNGENLEVFDFLTDDGWKKYRGNAKTLICMDSNGT